VRGEAFHDGRRKAAGEEDLGFHEEEKGARFVPGWWRIGNHLSRDDFVE